MTFWQIFVRVLPWRPLTALKSMWWHVTGRRVRARNQLRAAGARLPFAYAAWIRGTEKAGEVSSQAPVECSKWAWHPSFSILIEVGPSSSGSDLEHSISSIERQLYPEWVIFIAGPDQEDPEPDARRLIQYFGSTQPDLESILGSLPGDFIVPVRAGDQLSPWSLFRIAEALQSKPDARIVYGDHDYLDSEDRRTNPWFKPRWNEEMFLACDFLSGAFAIRCELARILASEFSPCASFDDLLLLTAGSGTSPIVHVPHIVAHLRSKNGHSPLNQRIDIVGRHVAERGGTASSGPFSSVKVSWPLPAEKPLVTIIIPTKDKLELLRPCVESVLEKTTYEPFEILIVDNGSEEPRTARYLDEIANDPRVDVLLSPGRYNYSAINNHAAGHAKGAYLCLLNNDTEVVEPDWLTELMRYASRPEIGAAGAKLLYPDQTIQHAGVIVGIGDAAGHAHRNLLNSDSGYFCHAHVAQFVSAVTGACLLVEKRKFLDVGGLDEESLAVAFNDVDLCLKLEQAGWRNVYVPHAVLIHHESKSRGKDHSPSQIDRYREELRVFQERWGTKSYDDPSFNPNLDRSSETFLIRL